MLQDAAASRSLPCAEFGQVVVCCIHCSFTAFADACLTPKTPINSRQQLCSAAPAAVLLLRGISAHLRGQPAACPGLRVPLRLHAECRLEAAHQRGEAVGVVAQQRHLAAAAAGSSRRQHRREGRARVMAVAAVAYR